MLSVVTTFAAASTAYSMQHFARVPVSRVVPGMLRRIATGVRMEIDLEEAGEFGTTDYSMTFKKGGEVVSPWHDMPLELEGGLFNMLTEIPKMTFKKMEVDTKAAGNPIKQDEKKGKARLYHGPIFWNYGCLPQTWEDPNHKGDADVGGAFGDDDPVDVVEIGAASLEMGSFTPVKVLGCLSMIDDGELDWKVIAINAADEHAAELNDVDDIEKFYPGTVSGIREWFRWYKTPDGKPVNGFGHGERALNAAETKAIIAETNGFYKKLLSGETEAGKLWVPSKA
jgi:inorganic pyrophosphatase